MNIACFEKYGMRLNVVDINVHSNQRNVTLHFAVKKLTDDVLKGKQFTAM